MHPRDKPILEDPFPQQYVINYGEGKASAPSSVVVVRAGGGGRGYAVGDGKTPGADDFGRGGRR